MPVLSSERTSGERRRQVTGPPTALGGSWERTRRNNGLEVGPTRNNQEAKRLAGKGMCVVPRRPQCDSRPWHG